MKKTASRVGARHTAAKIIPVVEEKPVKKKYVKKIFEPLEPESQVEVEVEDVSYLIGGRKIDC